MKSFVRKVRSKSPFRRRKRVETLVMDVREKEQAFLEKQLGSSSFDQTASQPDESAQIEVVLESSPDFGKANGSQNRNNRQNNNATRGRQQSLTGNNKSTPERGRGRKNERLPELAASSSVSTEEPTNTQAAAERFMKKQQQIAAKNRRKSFRDRFMRPPKNSPFSAAAHKPPDSPAKNTKGGLARGRSAKTIPLERGRTRERVGRGSSKASTKDGKSRSANSKTGSMNKQVDPLLDCEGANDKNLAGKPVYYVAGESIKKPVTIDVGLQSRVSELSSPAAMLRQESLGTQSIQGVRVALQKMEMELAAAGAAGKRVPRDKIMKALNFMATSLHQDDQKEALAKELDEWIDESVLAGTSFTPGTRVDDDEEVDDESDEFSDSDDSGSTFDLDAFDDSSSRASSTKQRQFNNPLQDLFQRLGKFFTVSDEDKKAVRQVVEDLLWNELVGKPRKPAQSKDCLTKGDGESASSEDSFTFDPFNCDLQDPRHEPRAPTRGRSWWRHNGGKSSRTGRGRPPSPESKLSIPSPTGRVNPREKHKVKKRSVASPKKGASSTRASEKKSMPKERNDATRYAKEGSDISSWSSVDDSAFMHPRDRYRIPPSSSDRAHRSSRHYKKTPIPATRQDNNFFDPDFLESPREADEFDDKWDECFHSAENLGHQGRLPGNQTWS